MRRAFRYVAAAIGFGVLISVGVVVKGLRDANDYIDRCGDETSGRYIFDKGLRANACK